MPKTLENRMYWYDIEQLSTPGHSGAFDVWKDAWWLVNEKGQIALYERRSPQCNLNEFVAKRLLVGRPEFIDAVQIPLVFIPHRCEVY